MNKVILMGRLTRDVELKQTQTSNTSVANFGLAVNRRFVKEGEERQADFINIVAWGKLGEFCSKYFKKGQQIGVVGRIQTRTWDDDQGMKHYVTEVVAEEAYFADSKRDGAPNEMPAETATDITNTFAGVQTTTTNSGDDLPF